MFGIYIIVGDIWCFITLVLDMDEGSMDPKSSSTKRTRKQGYLASGAKGKETSLKYYSKDSSSNETNRKYNCNFFGPSNFGLSILLYQYVSRYGDEEYI